MKKFLERFQLNNINLGNLKNLSKSGLGDFHSRQKIMLIALVALGIFMLFYWTNEILATKRASTIAAVESTQDRITRVHVLVHRIDDKRANAKNLDTGLLSFVQGLGNRTGIRGKLVNIRLVSSANRQEQVTFRTENLVLKSL
jgi:energy-converting hydrogenase Eha subunit C